MSQALVRIAAGWLLGLMLAVAASIVGVNVVNNTVASPQQPVREYLDALQEGDGGKALGLLRATVPPGNAAMLDGTALKTAASRLANVTIGEPEERSGNQVMVPVQYTIDGSRLRTEFLLEQTGTEWLFFNDLGLCAVAAAHVGHHGGERQRSQPQRCAGEHAGRPELLCRFLPRRIRGLPQR